VLSLRTAARGRLLTIVGLTLYAAVLVSSPFEHHDLVCHLKTPQHCMSCASSQLGSNTQVVLAPGAAQLPDAGYATSLIVLDESAVLVVRSTGRSPPSYA
jgi:hypothetical protein